MVHKIKNNPFKFKPNEAVMIVSGKFKGLRGWISGFDDREHGADGWNYYTVGAGFKKTRHGIVKASDIGLGEVVNVPEHHLKKVI
jgi:hypothetical protein